MYHNYIVNMETGKIATFSFINKKNKLKSSYLLTRGHFVNDLCICTYQINVLVNKDDGGWLKFKNRAER